AGDRDSHPAEPDRRTQKGAEDLALPERELEAGHAICPDLLHHHADLVAARRDHREADGRPDRHGPRLARARRFEQPSAGSGVTVTRRSRPLPVLPRRSAGARRRVPRRGYLRSVHVRRRPRRGVARALRPAAPRAALAPVAPAPAARARVSPCARTPGSRPAQPAPLLARGGVLPSHASERAAVLRRRPRLETSSAPPPAAPAASCHHSVPASAGGRRGCPRIQLAGATHATAAPM